MNAKLIEQLKAIAKEWPSLQHAQKRQVADVFFAEAAALIDEVRGVDAEPVGYTDLSWLSVKGNANIVKKPNDRSMDAVYTHPAPSQLAAPVETWTDFRNSDKTAPAQKTLESMAAEAAIEQAPELAAPVELPVVGYLPGPDGEPLVKLSDAQAAIAAGRKA